MVKKLLLIVIFISLLSSCSTVKVKYESSVLNWGTPGTYIATDGFTDVEYYSCYNDGCCHLNRQVLEALAIKANKDDFSWSKMEDTDFRKQKLKEQCEELKLNQVSRH